MNVETLTAHGSLIHGMLSSLITIPLCHPLFTVKTRQMTGQGFPPLREVYRGYGANQFCDVNYVAVAYLANNFFTKTIMQGKELNTAELFLGGFFSGIIAAPIQAVIERVMIVQQAAKVELSTQKTLLSIYKQGGALGIFRGITPTMWREATNCTCFFALSKTIEPTLKKTLNGSDLASPVAYLVSGMIAGFVTTPFDLAKTLMQEDVTGSITVKKAYKQLLGKGYHGLFRGATARMATIGATTACLGILTKVIPPLLPSSLHTENETKK